MFYLYWGSVVIGGWRAYCDVGKLRPILEIYGPFGVELARWQALNVYAVYTDI
jgi:hypothetical protein